MQGYNFKEKSSRVRIHGIKKKEVEEEGERGKLIDLILHDYDDLLKEKEEKIIEEKRREKKRREKRGMKEINERKEGNLKSFLRKPKGK